MSDFLAEVRAFVRDTILGHEKELDAPGDVPRRFYEAFAQKQLHNWWLPQQYGGRGISMEESVDVVAELSYGDAGLAFGFFIPILSSTAIRLFGSEAQRARYLPVGMAGATMASEKAAGSELLLITTKATKLADGSYQLNGEKFFSTNAGFSDYWIVYARTEEKDVYKAFIVPKAHPGVRVVQKWPMIGLRASGTYEMALAGCDVPADSALEANGLRVLEVALNASRLLIAASGIGVARRTRDLCLDYARDKKINDVSLQRNEVFAAKIGQMQIYIDTMTSVCKDAARQLDAIFTARDATQQAYRRGILKSVIVAKSMCGQLGWNIVSTGSEMFGGLGYTEHSIMNKLMRDMRYISIVEAGDDVMRSLMYTRFVTQ